MGSVWPFNRHGVDSISSSSGDIAGFPASSTPYVDDNGGRFATRKVVTSQCRTEEVEPGKFIRKCQKTEQIFKDSVGRPSEMVQSNKEITEEDVTDKMVTGSVPSLAEHRNSYFPGLRDDIEAIERGLFGEIGRFFQAAEEMKNEFFNSVRIPHGSIDDAPSSQNKHEIHIESRPFREDFPKNGSDGGFDLSGLAKDV